MDVHNLQACNWFKSCKYKYKNCTCVGLFIYNISHKLNLYFLLNLLKSCFLFKQSLGGGGAMAQSKCCERSC